MANPRYNTQVTNQRGGSARVGKMGGGMMRPMYKKGGKVKKKETGVIEFRTGKKFKKVGPVQKVDLLGKGREKKMAGGRIAGAARRAQEHGYYTPDMGMKGGKMFRDGGKVGKKKPRVKVIGIGKAKDYPGIKKIIEMNKKGKKRFKDGGSATEAAVKARKKQERGEALKKPTPAQKGLKKLPTQVRNKMGYMKKGGRVHKNTSRMNRLEELGRVDAERGFTRKGKKNLKAEKKRIVGELRR